MEPPPGTELGKRLPKKGYADLPCLSIFYLQHILLQHFLQVEMGSGSGAGGPEPQGEAAFQ
jgi:hypothetical protein